MWGLAAFTIGWILWLLNSIQRRTDHAAIVPNEPILLSGFEFYPRRDLLKVHRPLSQTVTSARELWLLWNAGTEGGSQNITKSGKVRRVLLPHPKSQALTFLAKAVDRDKQDIISDILVLTKQSLDNNVEVKWFNSMVADTITIGDPRDEAVAWAQLETVIPCVESGERPAIRIERQQFGSLFDTLKRAYEQRWTDRGNITPDRRLISEFEGGTEAVKT
jgi:hypothetical protein